MKFKDLEKCPFCGNDEFYEKQKVKGYIYPNFRLDGNDAHNEDLYDTIDISYNGKAYCNHCHKYLGNYYDDTVSKTAEKKVKGVMNDSRRKM